MPSIINATTSTGLVQTADNSGSLQLQTNNGTTAVTIDTSQRVGIGTSSPSQPLTVRTSGTSTSVGGNIAARIESNGSGYASTLQFSDNVANSAYISMISSATAFGQAGTEQMRITSGGDLQMNSGYGSVATAYGCRAWVNFNGTGTVAIRSSGNVSSITDNGVGDYTVNFTNALTDANYSVTGSSSGDTSSHYSYVCVRMNNNGTNSPSAFQTSSIRFIIRNDGGANTIDTANISLSVFR
jgi:hypothetical protein